MQDQKKHTGLTSQTACWSLPWGASWRQHLRQYWLIITRVSWSPPTSPLRDHSSARSHFDVSHSLSSLVLQLIVLWLKQPFPVWAIMVTFPRMYLCYKQAECVGVFVGNSYYLHAYFVVFILFTLKFLFKISSLLNGTPEFLLVCFTQIFSFSQF